MAEEPGRVPTVEELQREKEELLDRLLRLQAEFDNYRKRVKKEIEERTQSGREDLLLALVEVLDDVNRALSQSPGDEVSHEGLRMIRSRIEHILGKEGVVAIETEGCPFDPRVHEAVLREETPDHPEGVVLEEIERGYVRGERVLRPAKVKVAVAPTDPPKSPTTT